MPLQICRKRTKKDGDQRQRNWRIIEQDSERRLVPAVSDGLIKSFRPPKTVGAETLD
jgi:hypothetical protein